MATKVNMILGSHAAIKGGKFPFVEKMVENLSIKIKIAPATKPIARCAPLPPLTLRLAITAPINVSINTEIGVARRRYSSTSKVFKPSVPRNSWSCIY